MKDWMVITLYVVILFLVPLFGVITHDQVRPDFRAGDEIRYDSYRMAYNGGSVRVILPR